MKIDMIDLEDFFSDEYRYAKNKGIGATGIITTKQMVTRFNREEMDYDIDKMVSGLGSHEEQKIAIVRDIFGFDDVLDNGLDYYDPDLVGMDLDDNYKKMMNEVIEIKYMNNSAGNTIVIFLPKTSGVLTTEQLEAINYMGTKIEEFSETTGEDVEIHVTDGTTYEESVNSIQPIMSYLYTRVDDSYTQSIEDKNVLAEKNLYSNVNVFN